MKRIAYAKSLGNGRSEIWLARLDGSGKRRVGKGSAPVISPDRRWVAVAGDCKVNGCGSLYVVASGGGTRRRLLLRDAVGPRWDPGSQWLVVQRPKARALVRIDRATGKRTLLARGDFGGVSVAPNGRSVLFGRTSAAGSDLFVVDDDGRNLRRLTYGGQSSWPVWTRDGILFSRLVPFRGWRADEIWRIDKDGGSRTLIAKTPRRLLVSGVTGLLPIGLSDDGTHLLAALGNEFGAPPYAVDPRTGSTRELGRSFGYHSWTEALSRDGRHVLVVEPGPNEFSRGFVYVIPYAGGPAHVIATGTDAASWNY